MNRFTLGGGALNGSTSSRLAAQASCVTAASAAASITYRHRSLAVLAVQAAAVAHPTYVHRAQGAPALTAAYTSAAIRLTNRITAHAAGRATLHAAIYRTVNSAAAATATATAIARANAKLGEADASATGVVIAALTVERRIAADTSVSATVTALPVAVRYCTALATAWAVSTAYAAGVIAAEADGLAGATAAFRPRVTRYLSALAVGVVSAQAYAKHRQRAYALLPTAATHTAAAHHVQFCFGVHAAAAGVTGTATRRLLPGAMATAASTATATARQRHRISGAAAAAGTIAGVLTYRHRAWCTHAQVTATVVAVAYRPLIPITTVVAAQGQSLCAAVAIRKVHLIGTIQGAAVATALPERHLMGTAEVNSLATATADLQKHYSLTGSARGAASSQCSAYIKIYGTGVVIRPYATVVAYARNLNECACPPECVRYIRQAETRMFSRRGDNLEFNRSCG